MKRIGSSYIKRASNWLKGNFTWLKFRRITHKLCSLLHMILSRQNLYLLNFQNIKLSKFKISLKMITTQWRTPCKFSRSDWCYWTQNSWLNKSLLGSKLNNLILLIILVTHKIFPRRSIMTINKSKMDSCINCLRNK